MLDILVLSVFLPGAQGPPRSWQHDLARTLCVLVVLLAVALALYNSYRHRATSGSYSADLTLSVFAPFTYWILYALGAVSAPVAATA